MAIPLWFAILTYLLALAPYASIGAILGLISTYVVLQPLPGPTASRSAPVPVPPGSPSSALLLAVARTSSWPGSSRTHEPDVAAFDRCRASQ